MKDIYKYFKNMNDIDAEKTASFDIPGVIIETENAAYSDWLIGFDVYKDKGFLSLGGRGIISTIPLKLRDFKFIITSIVNKTISTINIDDINSSLDESDDENKIYNFKVNFDIAYPTVTITYKCINDTTEFIEDEIIINFNKKNRKYLKNLLNTLNSFKTDYIDLY